MRLRDKVTLITGAGSGIGLATAELFAREGAKVVVAELNPKAGEDVVRSIEAAGGQATFIRTDASVEADAKAAVDHAVATYGGLHVLFNNAGMPGPTTWDVTLEEWHRVIDVNLTSMMLFCKYAVPVMIQDGGGSIINTSSTSGLVGGNSPSYNAAKGGMVVMAKGLAVTLGKHNIRVNCVCPGPIDTPMNPGFYAGLPQWETVRQNFIASLPLGRFGQPSEVASCVLFLASDDSSFVTGHALSVDGGHVAR
ncbi:MAG: SDR family oxidoreductase [Chloroflexi bacterium]|nr:SDR family oxidoreductase [Chloroflexota bacterium]